MTKVLQELRARAKSLGERVAPVLEGLSEAEAAQRALSELCADSGGGSLSAWCVPERDGGANAGDLCGSDRVSVRALCELRDELAWHSGLLEFVLVMQGLGSYPIALGGSGALRKEVMPDVVRGARVAAFALTEPDAGSSLGDIATRATKASDGSYRLTGQKTFISNAGIAAFYTVLARTSGEPGDGGSDSLSMFFVPANSAGIEVRPFEVMAPHPIGEVHFHDVKVPAEHLLGKEGGGLGLALGTLNRFRTSVAAAANGFSRRALDESRTRLQGRSQFGRPLSSFQALRFDLAEMDCRLRAAQLLVDEAAAAVDHEKSATAEVARAKLFSTETASWICDRAVQHFGGLGVKRGVLVERLFREVRALRIYEGTSEIQKLILAKELLKRD